MTRVEGEGLSRPPDKVRGQGIDEHGHTTSDA
jgi:hypothetical protein